MGFTTDMTFADISPETWIDFLRAQRWFGAKGGVPTTASVADVIPLPWKDEAFAIVLLDVQVDGMARRYQLPLIRGRPTPSDATQDPDFRRALADAVATGVEVSSERGACWIVESLSAQRVVVPQESDIRVGNAEQSNTSIIFGEQAILKLFRRLESGIHPDLEVTRFLTADAGFPRTPVVLGSIKIEEPGASGEGGDRPSTVAGVVQEYMKGSRDGWSFALETARVAFDPGRAGSGKQAELVFHSDAQRLGAITREMHQALAKGTSPEFSPEPATESDVERWAQRTKHWAHDALALLERQLGSQAFDRARRPEAEALVARRGHYLAWIDELVDAIGADAGLRIRTHGDYHLGQVLRTASNDFVIIDFEGEPARPLSERREKGSALRDVAGMLRSFAYASAVLLREKSGAKREQVAQAEVTAGRWERDVRAAFLAEYMKAPEAGALILPRSDDNGRKLLSLFEAEKVFYELVYELNNRPDWAWIPMRGISKLLVG